MGFAFRVLIGLMSALAMACGGGGSSGGSADMGVVGGVGGVVDSPDGIYRGVGTFFTNVRVVNLGSNTPPATADCLGDIDITVDSNAADVIVGSGSCLLPANVISYNLVGGFINDTDFEGEITLRFSGVDHVLSFAGARAGDKLSATFSGRTPQVGQLVVDWNGNFDADRI